MIVFATTPCFSGFFHANLPNPVYGKGGLLWASLILAVQAMDRGAGEVAPLMLVGAVKMAPELPVDGLFPFLHPERSFMHLGFHIYDLGFQSQNSDAAKPLFFTTTLLLIMLIMFMNLLAILLPTRLVKQFQGADF